MQHWANNIGWSTNTDGFLNADGENAAAQGKPFSFPTQMPQVGMHHDGNGNAFGMGRDLASIKEQVASFFSTHHDEIMEKRNQIISTNSDRSTFTPSANASLGMGSANNTMRKRKPFFSWFFGR